MRILEVGGGRSVQLVVLSKHFLISGGWQTKIVMELRLHVFCATFTGKEKLRFKDLVKSLFETMYNCSYL